MDTVLKLLEPLIEQIEALALLAGVFLVLHFAIKHKVKAKRLKIAELKNKIKARLSWEDADVSKLKELGNSALDATVVTAASTGVSLLESYLAVNSDQPVASALNSIVSSDAASTASDIVSGADAASAASDIVSGADAASTTSNIVSGIDAASTASDIVSGADSAGAVADTAGIGVDAAGNVAVGADIAGPAVEGGALDALANSTNGLDATAHVPVVSAVLFGIRTLRNAMRLAKSQQTGREAGINIGMDLARIGIGGAGAMGFGKLGAAAGSALAAGAGSLLGGGIGIFAGSLFGSQLVNNARRTLKWGKIEDAQEYFGSKFIEGGFPEFTDNYVDELFNTAELRERLEAEKEKLKGYSAELDPYKDKEVTVNAVLADESVDFLETALAKAEYVKKNLRGSMINVCSTLTSNMTAKNAGVRETGLAGELVLQAPQCLELTESEELKVEAYNRQKASSKDYPCRFETTGTAVLETLSMQLFDKYVPDFSKPILKRKPVMLILFGITMAALAGVIAYGLI